MLLVRLPLFALMNANVKQRGNNMKNQLTTDPPALHNYPLRDIPDEVWIALQHLAIDERTSVKDVMLRALAAYVGR